MRKGLERRDGGYEGGLRRQIKPMARERLSAEASSPEAV